MIAAQVAAAILLVVGALTTSRNLLAVLNQPLGFNPQNVIFIDALPNVKDATAFVRRTIAALEQHPDVISAGAGTATPYHNLSAHEAPFVSPSPFREVRILARFLETLQVRVRDGRLPGSDPQPVDLDPAVLSETAARRLFPDRRAVGETYTAVNGRRLSIVAVVQDEIWSSEIIGALVYLAPRETRSDGHLTILVRTRTRNAATLADVRRAVVALVSADTPVSASWMSDSIGNLSTYRNPRFQALVLGSFGALALGLAALGIFGVIAATVGARAREISIRLAIGATPRALIGQVFREASIPIAAGITIGVLATQLVARVTTAQIAELDVANYYAIVVAVLVVAGSGTVAAYVPARRAARVDPIIVLRAE